MIAKLTIVVLLLAGAAAAHTVVLTWQAPPWPTALRYRVLRSRAKGGPYAQRWTGKALTWTDKYVVNGRTYYYVATALDPVTRAESGYSNEVELTIPNGVHLALSSGGYAP